MKKSFWIFILSFLPVISLTACNIRSNDKIIGEEEKDDTGVPLNPSVRKWYEFNNKLSKIVSDYFSVQTDIVATSFWIIDEDWDGIIKNQKEDELTGYWRNDQKIKNYQNLQEEYLNLPKIGGKKYQKEIDLIFKTMQFWIMYKHFGDEEFFIRSFNSVFKIGEWKDTKKYILTDSITINDLFEINWEYKTRKPNPNNSKEWFESYVKETQIKIFEFIQFHKYIEKLYDKYSKEDEINYKNGKYSKEIKEYETYIDMNLYKNWVKENQSKPGFGVWKEIG